MGINDIKTNLNNFLDNFRSMVHTVSLSPINAVFKL